MKSIIKLKTIVTVLFTALLLAGCADDTPTKINVEAVEKALNEVKADNPEGWTSAFEERVNEIYEGEGIVIVSVSNKTENNLLKVVGFIDKNGLEDYQEDDEKIFEIEQTAVATEQGTPAVVRSYTNYGSPVEHHTSLLGMMFQGWLIHNAMNSIFNNYHTPVARMSSLTAKRQQFRTSPLFAVQKAANTNYQKARQPVARVVANNKNGVGVKATGKKSAISLTKHRFGGGKSFGRARSFSRKR
jgi:hypothetical protein